ncbi:WxL protein peptidoglycan domain-containing protein [Weissella viridescens]|uniref:WxL protein peptidoglycan domain-containing protein n=1 Tax=Weissella viridescens TaxID=1629 RepID=UPI003AF2B64E
MMELRKLILMSTSIVLALTLFQLKAEAETIEGNVLSVTPVIDAKSNQNEPSFFKLANKPGKQYTVRMIVENMTNDEQRYVAEIQDANTNDAGQIVYMEKTTKSGVRQFVKNKRFDGTIGPKQSEIVSFKVKLPKSQVDKRTHLGGVIVMEKPKSDVQHSISNQFKIATSLTIADGATETNKLDSIQINKMVVGKNGLQTGYWMTVKNTSNKIINHVSYQIRVNRQVLNNHAGENGVMTLIPNETARIFVSTSQTTARLKDAKLILQKDQNRRTIDYKPKALVRKTHQNIFSKFVNSLESLQI